MKTDLHLRTHREGQSLYISRSKGCLEHSLQKHTRLRLFRKVGQNKFAGRVTTE